jgi:hypothetical protein
MAFKKIEVDPPIDTILPLKGAHRQVALEWIVKLIEQHESKDTVCSMVGIQLKDSEFRKVMRHIRRVQGQLQAKIDKTNGTDRTTKDISG